MTKNIVLLFGICVVALLLRGELFATATAPADASAANSTCKRAGSWDVDCELPLVYAETYGVSSANSADANDRALKALTTGIGKGGTTIVFPAGEIKYAFWDLSHTMNVTLVGLAGPDWKSITRGTQLTCTRADSGVCSRFQDNVGFIKRGLSFAYSSAEFSGIVVDESSSISKFNKNADYDVQYFASGNAIGASHASMLLFIHNNVEWSGYNIGFSGAISGLVGATKDQRAAGTNVVNCYSCQFEDITGAAILNPGLNWSFYGITVEPAANGVPSGVVGNNGDTIQDLSFFGGGFYDATRDGIWINLPEDIEGLTIEGVLFGGNAPASRVSAIAIGNRHVSGITISGSMSGFSTGIRITATIACSGLDLRPNVTNVATSVVAPAICERTEYGGVTAFVASGTGATSQILQQGGTENSTANIAQHVLRLISGGGAFEDLILKSFFDSTLRSYAGLLDTGSGANPLELQPSRGDTRIGGNLLVPELPTAAGGGGAYVCVDRQGKFYKKSTCP